MVLTNDERPMTTRITDFLVFLWGLAYLFFASIFTSNRSVNAESQNQARFGGGGRRGPSMGRLSSGSGPKLGG